MFWIIEWVNDIGLLDDPTCMHHRHPVAHPGDHAEIVRYEQYGGTGLRLYFLEQIYVL